MRPSHSPPGFRPYSPRMTDFNATATQAALPPWRLSDALGAAIASRTAGSPVSFGSEDLTTWIRNGECPNEETHFAVTELLQSMLADEARLLLIDERVDWDDLARFVLRCEAQDSCSCGRRFPIGASLNPVKARRGTSSRSPVGLSMSATDDNPGSSAGVFRNT